MRITVFGLGEAGSRIAADLAAAGAMVRGYDPAAVPTPPGVERFADPVPAVADADLIMAVTAAADGEQALSQARSEIPPGTVYADLSTSTPAQERALARAAADRGLAFADVALMSTVVGKGLRTPQLVAGTGARRYGELLRPFGTPVEVISDHAGDAATRKLLRSIFMKGLAGVVIEAVRAAHAAELGDWLWEHVVTELTAADEETLVRLVAGSVPHAERRREEMTAAASLLDELDVDAPMTRATVTSLEQVLEIGVPDLPRRDRP